MARCTGDDRWSLGLRGSGSQRLRPMRYVVTGDGLLIAGSEAGMVPIDEATVVEKGALGPGQMLAVDMKKGEMFRDGEIKDSWPRLPFSDWVGKINELDDALASVTEKAMYSAANCASARSLRVIRLKS